MYLATLDLLQMFRENYGGDEKRIGKGVKRSGNTEKLKLVPVIIYFLFI
jgi:hypothetical protein